LPIQSMYMLDNHKFKYILLSKKYILRVTSSELVGRLYRMK
jgi:hypothetical protein